MGAPPLLYHYTDADGLVGIVESSCLWASRATFLNDSKEVRHAFEVALANVGRVKIQSSGLEAFAKHLTHPQVVPPLYVISLSTAGDQLSQWRGYGDGGANSYAIGFRGPSLEAAAQSIGWALTSCIYDPDDQQKLIVDTLDEFAADFADGRVAKESHADPDSVYLTHCRSKILAIAPRLKHVSFSEEREWRLVSPVLAYNEEKLFHRVGRWSIIPTVKFALPISGEKGGSLAEVIVGPGHHSAESAHLAMDAVSSLLARNEVPPEWAVRPSAIPFRI